MIFFAKRKNAPAQSSNTEACVSILGLAVIIGLLGGAAALIYGLIKGSSSETIAGGAVLGVSVVCSIFLVLVCVCCLKKNDINSNLQEHRTSSHQNHQMNRERTSSNQITHISAVHRSGQHHHHHHQGQPNGYDVQILSPSVHNGRLTDHSYGKQIPQSSSKIITAGYSNQRNNSVVNQNYRLSINSNTHRNSYNQP